jgi:multisubunit Na+/H+ antiporter MnhB subunit
LRSMSERKTCLALGMLIGIGVMLIILGFFGWLTTNFFFERLSHIFSSLGIDIYENYLIERLVELRGTYVGFVVTGLVCLLIGVFGVFKEKIPQKKLPPN